MKILWDFDGTLFDTYPAFTEAMYELLDGKAAKKDILTKLKVSFSHAAEYFELTDEQVMEYKRNQAAMKASEKPPFQGVKEVLDFAELNVIMTHKPRAEVDDILQHYGMRHYFKEIVAGDDGYKRKPDTAAYKYLHNLYGIDLVIGDRLLDILPAKQLGITTCLFQNSEVGADFYLENYKDFFQKSLVCVNSSIQ
ncbi:HAD-IA family hydrolase [Bacillus lacus]|uniref:HAD-IA family hydrolase n=1 Tax=Metabacillus lacus TaxID=1983721 RepID=A0A7X2IYU3_9BACI|nr:HAD-IA family hydrolase [Metabacillus lacus]MRX72300.1 HAD-IA family hydrolase [Metabacillus lacus]